MPFYDITKEFSSRIKAIIDADFKEVTTDDLGLDSRAGYKLWASEDGIVVRNSNRHSLDYYGGFEYVEKESITIVGDYTFYSADDDRVAQCLDAVFAIDE